MEDHELIELRSEEVQEILGTPPGWMVRWGTILIVFVVAMMVWLSYLIKYPDVITAPVIISSAHPPVPVLTASGGTISQIFVSDNSHVKIGSVLAILESAANYDDIRQVEDCCILLKQSADEGCIRISSGKKIRLGELQSQYEALQTTIDKYKSSVPGSVQKRGTVSSANQLQSLQKDVIKIETRIRDLKNDNLPQAEQFAAKQRSLYARGNLNRNDLEVANNRIADIKTEIAALEREKSLKEGAIVRVKSRLNEPRPIEIIDKSEERAKIEELASGLLTDLEDWKQKHLILSPVSGKVTFANRKWTAEQEIKAGEELLVIVPDENQKNHKISGEVKMPVQGAGKVKEGQRVIIMLESYPYQEFGTLEANVVRISHIPNENSYSVQLEFGSDTLVTNYQKQIPPARQLTGEAQIITEDKRFIQRIFEKIRVFSNKY